MTTENPLTQGNLFHPFPPQQAAEFSEVLTHTHQLRVERIVSFGHSSPAEFWYDQSEDEWVVLLSGSAVLQLADPEETHQLTPGDWIFLPAHRRHRVESTAADEPSVWLAVFGVESPPAAP